jgi:serine/threonine protein kinase
MANGTETELMQESTELMSGGTELMRSGGQSDSGFTGGFLQIGEVLEGWEITGRMEVSSGEAEVYYAKKDDKEGIVKYYRRITNLKTDILKKIQGLNHENIVNLYQFGLYKGHLFEIMEYAVGGGLDSRNEDDSYKYLPLSEEELIGVCEEIIDAFKKCREMGIIHRDIKPGNIFYRECSSTPDENGRYKGRDIVIGDFGISSVMEEGEQYRKTRTATRTSAYAAPEILYGEINEKYDYYSLGVTLWELAMGKEPFLNENGKRLDSTFVMQLAIEGFAADNLLRTKPLLSEKIQRLIRGLLVVNPEHRWGYQEVKDHLAGEKEVPVWVEKKEFKFTIGDKNCTNLEELAEAILDNPEAARIPIFEGQLKSVLKAKFPEKSKRIEEIAEEASAKRDHLNGIYKIAWSLSLNVPFKASYGYEARGADDISNLIANAPETMLPLLKDNKSRLYAYLEVVDKKEEADEIRAIASTAGNAELISKALVILCGRVITPYKLAKYRDFILDTPENLASQEIPGDLKNRILLLIKEKSCEGLVYPWIDLHLKENGVNEYDPKTWEELIGLFGQKKAA